MLIKNMISWLLPHSCILCGNLADRHQDLCHACHQDIPFVQEACQKCSVPFSNQDSTGLCNMCLLAPPPYDKAYTLFIYEMPITRLILELKFKHTLVNARVLGELLAFHIQHHWYKAKPLPSVIIPVPLHAKRLQERGFNQALEIARPIAKALKLPIDMTSCVRSKATLAQATLAASNRKQNIKNAFTIRKSFAGKRVAIIDDVITTGSTMNEFCRNLQQYGADSIDVWCVARPKML